MKRIYSIILLLSFMTGVVQPVIPMIEYYLVSQMAHQVCCIEMENPDMECTQSCCSIVMDCSLDGSSPDDELLDSSFYPIATGLVTFPDLTAFETGGQVFADNRESFPFPYLSIHSPPPQLV